MIIKTTQAGNRRLQQKMKGKNENQDVENGKKVGVLSDSEEE